MASKISSSVLLTLFIFAMVFSSILPLEAGPSTGASSSTNTAFNTNKVLSTMRVLRASTTRQMLPLPLLMKTQFAVGSLYVDINVALMEVIFMLQRCTNQNIQTLNERGGCRKSEVASNILLTPRSCLASKYDLYSKSKVRIDVEKVNRYCLSLSEKVSANKALVAVFPGEAKMVRLESFLKLTMAQYGYWCGQ
ncbi:hypothetical protein WN943_022122 [Citrus x changshan-huyou]